MTVLLLVLLLVLFSSCVEMMPAVAAECRDNGALSYSLVLKAGGARARLRRGGVEAFRSGENTQNQCVAHMIPYTIRQHQLASFRRLTKHL